MLPVLDWELTFIQYYMERGDWGEFERGRRSEDVLWGLEGLCAGAAGKALQAMNNAVLSPEIEEIADKIRQEPYSLFSNDCLTKSIHFVQECRKQNIDARVVCSIGLAAARIPLLPRRLSIPVFHCWAEVAGQRVEVSRPLGSAAMLGIVPRDIRPIIKFRLPERALGH